MPLKKSFCSRADLRLDLTRFAPLWALYSVGIAVVMLTSLSTAPTAYNFAATLRSLVPFTSVVELGYTFITAQCLFGYLYDTRQCYALHAMPSTRTQRFRAHFAAGILFALVPNAIACAVWALCSPAEARPAAGYFFVTLCGQHFFFWCLSVLCALCAGSRVGMTLVYGIANIGAAAAMWFTQYVYVPLLYGAESVDLSVFMCFCPVQQLAAQIFDLAASTMDEPPYTTVLEGINLQSGNLWWLLGYVCAGAVLAALAQHLYRRRSLERAGEMVAVHALKPVFLVLFSLITGSFGRVFIELFMGMSSGGTLFGFLIGFIALGYVGGKMLLGRTMRALRVRDIPVLAGLLVVVTIPALLISYDTFGVIRRVPEADEIEYIELSGIQSHTSAKLDDEDVIEVIRQLHSDGVSRWESWRAETGLLTGLGTTCPAYDDASDTYTADGVVYYNSTIFLEIVYHLNNGESLTRSYCLWTGSDAGQKLKTIASLPEISLGVESREEMDEKYTAAEVEESDSYGYYVLTQEQRTALYDALYADALAGNALPYGYQTKADDDGTFYAYGTFYEYKYAVSLEYEYRFPTTGKTVYTMSTWLCAYDSWENTLAALEGMDLTEAG